MMKKIEKDTDTVKSNRTMMNVGWAMLICSFIFTIWNNYSGNNSIFTIYQCRCTVGNVGGWYCLHSTINFRQKERLIISRLSGKTKIIHRARRTDAEPMNKAKNRYL